MTPEFREDWGGEERHFNSNTWEKQNIPWSKDHFTWEKRNIPWVHFSLTFLFKTGSFCFLPFTVSFYCISTKLVMDFEIWNSNIKHRVKKACLKRNALKECFVFPKWSDLWIKECFVFPKCCWNWSVFPPPQSSRNSGVIPPFFLLFSITLFHTFILWTTFVNASSCLALGWASACLALGWASAWLALGWASEERMLLVPLYYDITQKYDVVDNSRQRKLVLKLVLGSWLSERKKACSSKKRVEAYSWCGVVCRSVFLKAYGHYS